MFEYRNEYRTEYLTAANVPDALWFFEIFSRDQDTLLVLKNGRICFRDKKNILRLLRRPN